MSQPDRQAQITETLSLLSQMTPAALAANRDELFFRAGEASARSERRQSSPAHRVVWPAMAAALALVATGLGAALILREPEVRVVHIERRDHVDVGQAGSAANIANPRDGDNLDTTATEPAAWDYAVDEIRHRPNGDGMIHSQDWAALSDAFAGQLRMQQKRSQAAREAMAGATVENRGDDARDGAPPRQRVQTYLELRDAMQAL